MVLDVEIGAVGARDEGGIHVDGFGGRSGIGLLLYQYIQLFQFDRLLGVVIIIIVTVTVIDRLSDFLRRKFI